MPIRRRLKKWLKPQPHSSQQDSISQPIYTLNDWSWKAEELKSMEYWRKMHQDWTDNIEELGNGIYRVPLFEEAWYKKWLQEIALLHNWILNNHIDSEQPNSMHNYGLMATELGLEALFNQWITEIGCHISALLYPEFGTLDHCHAFWVNYGKHTDQSLGFHADDSEVTFNFCLGDDFQGSELYFQGRRCFEHLQSPHHPHEEIIVEHIPGTCIVHAGLHRHGVYPILKGNRQNLILWGRSSEYRRDFQRQNCYDWCGLSPKDGSIQ